MADKKQAEDGYSIERNEARKARGLCPNCNILLRGVDEGARGQRRQCEKCGWSDVVPPAK